MIGAIRAFFAARSFVEVDTPALQRSPGLEPHLDAFATRLARPGEADAAMFLHTSPEFAMKKLLAAGMDAHLPARACVPQRRARRLHHPEFMLLEWYRAGGTYRDLMADCEALLRAALDAAGARAFALARAKLPIRARRGSI